MRSHHVWSIRLHSSKSASLKWNEGLEESLLQKQLEDVGSHLCQLQGQRFRTSPRVAVCLAWVDWLVPLDVSFTSLKGSQAGLFPSLENKSLQVFTPLFTDSPSVALTDWWTWKSPKGGSRLCCKAFRLVVFGPHLFDGPALSRMRFLEFVPRIGRGW